MLDTVFRGLFDTALTDTIAPGNFLLCVGVSLILGLLLCAMTGWQSRSSLTMTPALSPAVVCVVIMMANGNVGTGVAVAGAFSLVRFRSAPGTAREISAIFVAMGTGLIAGMGYLAYATLFALILGAATMAYTAFSLRPRNSGPVCRTLHITVPEDLDYYHHHSRGDLPHFGYSYGWTNRGRRRRYGKGSTGAGGSRHYQLHLRCHLRFGG